MSAFDPELAGKMVADYAPARPAKFQDLLPARNVIAELRQKGASFRAIADLLSRHNLTTSKTAVTIFCHEVLDDPIRSRRRVSRKKESAPVVPPNEPVFPVPTPLANSKTDEMSPARSRGPRIAQVRMRKPHTT
jgi:hypothetical protein